MSLHSSAPVANPGTIAGGSFLPALVKSLGAQISLWQTHKMVCNFTACSDLQAE
ncbi:MAG: hypothetical protein HHJ12_09785 [Glaciimonas sp.]|nr:hypothetical protein [Glaciimonas sp.]